MPTPLTAVNSFTGEIEGPAVDKQGYVFAVSFQRKETIGRVSPDGKAELFIDMPRGSTGNGIRFDQRGRMFVADYTGHNILLVNPKTKAVKVFAHNPSFNQPNDIAITADGTLYASDPNWKEGTGQIWRIDRKGRVTKAASDMGTTNGIDVSPDGRRLYVNESVQRNVWRFDIAKDGSLQNKRLLAKLVPAATLMILLGYPGEMTLEAGPRLIWGVLGTLPFLYLVYVLFVELTRSLEGKPAAVRHQISTLRLILVGTWTVYPIAYMFPVIGGEFFGGAGGFVLRQAGYSVADILAKAGFALLIYRLARTQSILDDPAAYDDQETTPTSVAVPQGVRSAA